LVAGGSGEEGCLGVASTCGRERGLCGGSAQRCLRCGRERGNATHDFPAAWPSAQNPRTQDTGIREPEIPRIRKPENLVIRESRDPRAQGSEDPRTQETENPAITRRRFWRRLRSTGLNLQTSKFKLQLENSEVRRSARQEQHPNRHTLSHSEKDIEARRLMIEVRSLKSEGQSSKFEVPWPAFAIQGLKIKVRSSQCDNAETSHQQATQYREATKKETNVQAKSHQRATNKPQQVTGKPQTSHQQDGTPTRRQDTTRRSNPNNQRRPQ